MVKIVEVKPAQYRTDIVASLRAIADQIEEGTCDPTLLVVAHNEKHSDVVTTYAQGAQADDVLATVGLFEAAKHRVLLWSTQE